MERKKETTQENTKQKRKKLKIRNKKETNWKYKKKKKSYYIRESDSDQPHGSLFYLPLYHSHNHVISGYFSIIIDTMKVFFKIC